MQSRSNTSLVVGLLVVAVLAVGIGYLLLRPKVDAPAMVVKAPAQPTSRPATRPRAAAGKAPVFPVLKTTVDLPILTSPAEFHPAVDKRIGGLIDAHNQRQDKIAKVLLKGTCQWSFDGELGTPRAMSIDYE